MKSDTGGNRFVLPALVLLSLVTIYPVLYVSVSEPASEPAALRHLEVHGPRQLSLSAPRRPLLERPRNTVYFTAVSVSLELLLGLRIALLLNRKFRFKGLVTAIVLVPWAVPTVVSARMWEWMYNTDFGILNYLLGAKINWLGQPLLGLERRDLHGCLEDDALRRHPASWPVSGDPAGAVPGCAHRRRRSAGSFSGRITLPLLMPVILVVLIFRMLDAFRVFDAVYVLTGGGPANTTETLSIYAYKVLFQTLQFGYGSTLSVVVFLCVGGSVFST